MKKADPRKLVLAKAELKRAMGARKFDPKRIARAALRVADADPAFTDILFCYTRMIPLFRKLLENGYFKLLERQVLKATIKSELERIEKKHKIRLPSPYKRIAISSFIGTLRTFWKRDQKKNERKNKKR
jgi:hypothetical protein